MKLLTSLALSSAMSVLQAGVVAIDLSAASVTVGSTFSLNVRIDDIADLYAFQFDLAFDSGLISALSVDPGSILSGGSSFFPGTIDNSGGRIRFVGDSLSGPVAGFTGDGTLALITFMALGAGESVLSLENLILLDSALADLAADAEASTVTVVPAPVPVPEPSSAGLIGVLLSLTPVYRLATRGRSVPEQGSLR